MHPAVVQIVYVAHNRKCPGSWREFRWPTVLNIICSEDENSHEEQQCADIAIHIRSNYRNDWIHSALRGSTWPERGLCFYTVWDRKVVGSVSTLSTYIEDQALLALSNVAQGSNVCTGLENSNTEYCYTLELSGTIFIILCVSCFILWFVFSTVSCWFCFLSVPAFPICDCSHLFHLCLFPHCI